VREHVPPAFERLPAGEMNVQHGPCARPHGGEAVVISGQCGERGGEPVGVARHDREAAVVPRDQLGDLSVGRSDGDDRPAGGRDAVEFARNDEAFEVGPQRDPVYVGDAERIFQNGAVLIGNEPKHLLEAQRLDAPGQLDQPVSAADKQKDDASIALQALGRRQDGIEFVGPPKVAGIPEHEFVRETPFPAQRIVAVTDG